jgi:Holliday junction resolvase RusA-like endonuclease
MMSMSTINFTIFGEPASKANSRRLVENDGKKRFIKSEKALDYESDALRQIPPAFRLQLEGQLRITLRIYYASQRPDLDESVILDVLQDRYKTYGRGAGRRKELIQRGVYINDRQVREKHVFHSIDKKNPRAEIMIETIKEGA